MPSRSSIKDLFADAAEMPPGEQRDAFIRTASAGDMAVVATVQQLLAADAGAGQLLAEPRAGVAMVKLVSSAYGALGRSPAEAGRLAEQLREGVGSVLGPYTLTGLLGEGGFGVVYLAHQDEPVRRDVALKILKPGMDTREVAARFRTEQETLGLMEHPGIARVLDAGTTPAGRPFVVMELVPPAPGAAVTESVTDYADRKCLSIAQRIGLVISICRALQHAHSKGVIHRDIKPSNVLVTEIDGLAVCKIIDFGIAKATHGKAGPAATEHWQIVGTPEYMAPEQLGTVNGAVSQVDVRTDVYGVGTLLYELLCAQTPLDAHALRAMALPELHHALTVVEPSAPSARISKLLRRTNPTATTEGGAQPLQSRQAAAPQAAPSPQAASPLPGGPNPTGPTGERVDAKEIATARGLSPEQLARQLKGELDWIVACCLEKTPARRYQTIAALGEELTAFLEHRPVRAGPPTVSYVVGKWVRRHRGLTLASSIVLASVVAGVAGTGIALYYAAKERTLAVSAAADAKQQAGRAESVTRFLLEDMLGALRPDARGSKDITVKEIAEIATSRLPQRFDGSTATRWRVQATLADVWLRIGEHNRAGNLFREILAAAEERGEGDSLEMLPVLLGLARISQTIGDHVGNRDYSSRAVAASSQLSPSDPRRIEAELVMVRALRNSGDVNAPRALLALIAEPPADEIGLRIERLRLMSLNSDVNDDGRIQRLSEALALAEVAYGPDHSIVQSLLQDRALVHADRRNSSEAIADSIRSLELARRMFAPDSNHLLFALGASLSAYLSGGPPYAIQAAEIGREAITLTNAVHGENSLLARATIGRSIDAFSAAGRHQEAIAWSTRLLEVERLNSANLSSSALMTEYRRAGRVQLLAGNRDLALQLIDDGLAVLGSETSDWNIGLRRVRGDILLARGEPMLAVAEFERAVGTFSANYGAAHPRMAEIGNAIYQSLNNAGYSDLAQRFAHLRSGPAASQYPTLDAGPISTHNR